MGENARLQTAGRAHVLPVPWMWLEDCTGEHVLRRLPTLAAPGGGLAARLARITLCVGFLKIWAFCLGLGGTGIVLRRGCLPQLGYGHAGAAGELPPFITLPSVNPPAELDVNHRPINNRPINDHGKSRGFDAAMRPEIGEVTAWPRGRQPRSPCRRCHAGSAGGSQTTAKKSSSLINVGGQTSGARERLGVVVLRPRETQPGSQDAPLFTENRHLWTKLLC